MRSLFSIGLITALLMSGGIQGLAQGVTTDTFVRPAPLLTQPSALGPTELVWMELNARRALEAGLYSVASDLCRQIVDTESVPIATRNRVIIDWATALLADDRAVDAESVLKRFVGVPSLAHRLRVSMVEISLRRGDDARKTVGEMKAEDFNSEEKERSWWFFVRGLLADDAREYKIAGELYRQAIDSAVTPSQRGWFVLAAERAKIALGEVNETIVASLRQTMERNQGRATGYMAISQLAVALNALNRRGEALALLQQRMLALPRSETQVQDEWRLLIGMIGGAGEGSGRIALRTLIASGNDRDKQRAALRLIVQASQQPARSEELQNALDEWIALSPSHPILEDLLYFRAQLALASRSDARVVQAERDANRIMNEFPASGLRVPALEVLTAISWKGGFYRNAAVQASRAHAELPPGLLRGQFAVVVAEAYFRGKDYRNAADAYGSALSEVPAGILPGDLMFQRILSLIEANELVEAQAVLDSLTSDPRFDSSNRWQAEWNLARTLQIAGDTRNAMNRVDRLLEGGPDNGAIAPDLRARMAWLQMRLAYEVGEYAKANAQADAIIGGNLGASPALRTEISSTAALLKAQATLAQRQGGGNAAAIELLRKLRSDHPGTEAAIYSYLVEADAESAQGHPVEAQKLLRRLADDYKESGYAPYALYQAALYAERRGAPEYYNEAYKILEELVRTYPENLLVFYARLKQGNLLRLLNDYGGARTIYQDLVNRYRAEQVPDVFSAHLALADCYAADETAKADSASAIYERLLGQPSAPLDLRMEAGCKLGLGLVARKNLDRARSVWWQMVNEFLLDDARAARLGSRGRYWMSRTLLSLAKLLEDQGKPREALTIYNYIPAKGLPGVALASEGITRTGGIAPR